MEWRHALRPPGRVYPLSNLKHLLHLVEGEAGPTIPHLAGKERIDLVIMSTVARASMEGYFIGNTAETVLHRVACSVLTVKPNRTYDSHLCTER
jgi:universal stress protein E